MLKRILGKNIIAPTLLITVITVLMLTGNGYCAISSQADWATLKTPHFMVHAPNRANLYEIGKVAEDIYAQMAPRYNYRQEQRTDLYIFTDRSAFLYDSPSENAAGYASPSQNLIAILLGVGNSTITLGHEINHIVFMRSVPRVSTVPDWFVEGLAIYESQPGIEASKLEDYVLVRDIPDLTESSDPDKEHKTREEYAQGYLKINFIIDKFGRHKLYEVIAVLQAGEDFDTALVKVLGSNQNELNTAWKKYAHDQRNIIWLIRLRYLGSFLLGFLLIIAIVVAPLRRRKRLREMEEEDEEEESQQLEIEELDEWSID